MLELSCQPGSRRGRNPTKLSSLSATWPSCPCAGFNSVPFLLPRKLFACFWVLAAMPEGPALLQGFLKLWQFFLMAVLPQSWQPPGWVPLLCFGAESSWERELAAPLCCPKPRTEFPSLVSGCSEGFPSPSSPCGAPSWQRPAVPQGRCAKGFQCARALSLHSPCPRRMTKVLWDPSRGSLGSWTGFRAWPASLLGFFS